MDQLFQLLGLALPDTATVLRLKVLLAGGVGGVVAGVLLMASGVEGTLAPGAAIAACGVALVVLPIRSFLREARQQEAERAKPPRRLTGTN
jgi:hypothetical protein